MLTRTQVESRVLDRPILYTNTSTETERQRFTALVEPVVDFETKARHITYYAVRGATCPGVCDSWDTAKRYCQGDRTRGSLCKRLQDRTSAIEFANISETRLNYLGSGASNSNIRPSSSGEPRSGSSHLDITQEDTMPFSCLDCGAPCNKQVDSRSECGNGNVFNVEEYMESDEQIL